MNIKYSKGFTLIELLVVIAIISLVSSVILAAINDARDKARQKAFRSEVMNLINALELYKANTGSYPYENTATPSGNVYNYNKFNNNTETVSSGTLLSTLLIDYIKSTPKIPNPSGTTVAWSLRTNKGNATHYRCAGDTKEPPYVILIYTNNTLLFNAFSDLPYSEYSNSPYTTWTLTTSTKCFSLK